MGTGLWGAIEALVPIYMDACKKHEVKYNKDNESFEI